MQQSEPSDRVLRQARCDNQGDHKLRDAAIWALRAAHDPAHGLDRSVRLGDIVAWLRTDDGPTLPCHDVADAIEAEFGTVAGTGER